MRRTIFTLLVLMFCLIIAGCGSSTSQVLESDSQQLSSYVFENFGGNGDPNLATSWYGLIKKIEVRQQGDGVKYAIVSTNIYPDAEGKSFALPIANAVLFGPIDIAWVNVEGQNGALLIQKQKP